jgi:hypothetical protein
MENTMISNEPVKKAESNAPDTEPSGWVGESEKFLEGAPETVAELLNAKKWKSATELANGYRELEKLKGAGSSGIVIPEEGDTEGWNKVFDTIGRPAEPKEYSLDYQGDMELDDNLMNSFKEYAHGLGLTQKQFNEVVNFQLEAMQGQQTQLDDYYASVNEEATAALKKEWGDKYEANTQKAFDVANKLGIFETLENRGLGSDPEIIFMLERIASSTDEDSLAPQTPPAQEKTAQEKMADIKANPAFLDKFHPDHSSLMDEFAIVAQELSTTTKRPR